MRKVIILLWLFVLLVAVPNLNAFAEEAGWFYAAEGWIIRIYTTGTGPYNVNLEVINTSNALIPADNITGLSNNPYTVASDATVPDISLSFDETTGTAYVFYSNSSGVALLSIPDITYYSGSAQPILSVSPNSLDFGTVIPRMSKIMTVVVSNTGTADLHISSIGPVSSPFSIVKGTTCSTSTAVPAGNSCNIFVRFLPSGFATFTDNLSITSDGGNENVALTGTGGG